MDRSISDRFGAASSSGDLSVSSPGMETEEVRQPGTSFANLVRYPRRPLVVVLFFLLFVFARYIQLGARREILGTLRVEFLIGMAVIALTIFQLSSRKPIVGNSKPLLVNIGLLFFVIIIQVPLAVDLPKAQLIFVDKVIKFSFMTFIMVVLIESPNYLRWLLAAYIFSLFYVYQEAVYGLITGSLLWWNQGIMRLHGAVRLYAHPNSLASVAINSLPFVIFLFGQVQRKIFRFMLLPVAAASLTCIIYSGSRTAYVGLISLVLWWWFQSQHKKRFLVVASVIALFAIPKIPSDYIERFKSIGGQANPGGASSKEARKEVLRDAIIVFMENPLGVGVSSFPKARELRFGRLAQDTHNLYLEVATNLGVQGLVVFFSLVTILMIYFRRAVFDFRHQGQALLVAIRTSRPPPRLRQVTMGHWRDLQFLIAVGQAAGGLIWVRLVVGILGMDLYEPYWWFGSGLALVLSGLVVRTRRNTGAIVSALGEFPRNK